MTIHAYKVFDFFTGTYISTDSLEEAKKEALSLAKKTLAYYEIRVSTVTKEENGDETWAAFPEASNWLDVVIK